MNPSPHRMWSALLLVVSALSIAGCDCCPLPPSPLPSAPQRTIGGLGVQASLANQEALFGEMPSEAGDIMVADQLEFIGCGNVLRVARIPFCLDFEIVGTANFFIYVPQEKAELARSALSRWAECPGYRCEIVSPVSTVEAPTEK